MLLAACDGVGGVFGLPLPDPGLGLPAVVAAVYCRSRAGWRCAYIIIMQEFPLRSFFPPHGQTDQTQLY